MIPISEIQELAKQIRAKQKVEVVMPKNKTLKQIAEWNKKHPWPDYYPTYSTIMNEKGKVVVHADGVKPSWMFEMEYPGETDEELNHRNNTYRPITMTGWTKANAKTATIWNPANYSVTWPDEEQKLYFTNTYPVGGNMFNWLATYEHDFRMKDPNAIVYPWADNLQTEDDTELLNSFSHIEPSENVIWRGKTFVFINRGMKEDLSTFLVLDELNYYVVTQTKNNPVTFKVREVFEGGHNFDEVPFEVLGGKLAGDYYRSFYWPAIADLDNVLLDAGMLRITKDRFGYPKEVVYEDPCNGQGCEQGRVFVEMNEKTGEEIWRDCPKCLGRRVKSGVMRTQVIQTNGLNDDRAALPIPAIIEGSDRAPVMLRNEINAQQEMAWMAVNLQIVLRPEGKTATEVLKNHEDTHPFLKTIKDVEFPCARKEIRLCGKMRFRDKWQDPSITDPVNYGLRTASELSEEVGKAVEQNQPVAVRAGIIRQFENTRFALSGEEKEIMETLSFADELYYATDTEIMGKLAIGVLEKWQAYLHSSGIQLVEQLMIENSNWLTKSKMERRTDLWELAKTRVPVSQPSTFIEDVGA